MVQIYQNSPHSGHQERRWSRPKSVAYQNPGNRSKTQDNAAKAIGLGTLLNCYA